MEYLKEYFLNSIHMNRNSFRADLQSNTVEWIDDKPLDAPDLSQIQLKGTLEIIDFSIGEGILKYDKMSKSAPKTRAAGKSVSVWILWSCVDVEVSQAKAMDPKLEAAVEAFQNNGQDVIYDFKEETEAINGLTK